MYNVHQKLQRAALPIQSLSTEKKPEVNWANMMNAPHTVFWQTRKRKLKGRAHEIWPIFFIYWCFAWDYVQKNATHLKNWKFINFM